MSVYKVTFKNAPFGPQVADKYITADNVDTYSEVATFYTMSEPQQFNGLFTGNTQVIVAAFKEWLSIEVVDAVPFSTSQAGDSSEDI